MKYHTDLMSLCLVIGVLAFVAGCNQASAPKANQASTLKESSMDVAYKTDTTNIEIPPIDMAAPAEFETATFGLG
jgi:PBP1b-binding outer membrane lipoprotein LpoB